MMDYGTWAEKDLPFPPGSFLRQPAHAATTDLAVQPQVGQSRRTRNGAMMPPAQPQKRKRCEQTCHKTLPVQPRLTALFPSETGGKSFF